MCSVMSELKVLLFLLLLQFSILCYKGNIGYKVQFLVVFLVVVDFCILVKIVRASTVKQGILYWTCTGLAVEVIGLVPTCD